MKWGYRYSGPRGDGDVTVDADKVAPRWEPLEMRVTMNTQYDARVFATGGSLYGLSFVSTPEQYSIAGTSTGVPGDANNIIDQEYVG